MSILAVIPARGGSKRIPKKNIRDFCGKPIITYPIEAAVSSGIFSEVMVSTDNEEIAAVSKAAGAKVPFMRSKETSGDYTTVDDVVLEVLEEYKKIGKTFDYVCGIYPTAPFVTKELLLQAMELMEKYHPAQVMPMVQFSYPPQRCFISDGENYVVFKNPEYITSRSQDLEKQYHDAGQFFLVDVNTYVEKKGIIYEDIVPLIISERQVQDIDNETDWELAEMKYRLFRRGEPLI